MGEYTTSDGDKTTYKSGSKAGVEGAWFITPYLGVGGLATATTSSITIGEKGEATDINRFSTTAGAYISFPLSSVFRIGTKALVGANFTSNHEDIPTALNVSPVRMNLQTGASISYLARQNLAFKLFTDYSHSPNFITNKALNELTCGVSINLIIK